MMNKKLIFSALVILLINSTAYPQMFWNQACSFAGNSSSYASVKNSTSLDLTGSFSTEAWIYPTSLSGASKGIISKGGLLGTSLKYAIRLGSNGRISVITNGASRLTSKSSTALTINKWTHIAATYDSSTGQFSIYLNGVLDTSATVAGAAPTSNSDSLFVAISGASTPFKGMIDELRLWNKALTSTEISERKRSILATSSGIYSALVLSLTFQQESSLGSDFTSADFSDKDNHASFRNVTAVDNSNNPYTTIHNNESVFLSGGAYLSAKDTPPLNAVSAITIECWVYQTSSTACNYISKGSSPQVYSIGWSGTKLTAKINGTSLSLSSDPITMNRWNHIVFRYSNDGTYKTFVNGLQTFAGFEALGNINLTSDSLYIGGGPGPLAEFHGLIDEVRITKDFAKNQNSIIDNINESIDAANVASTITNVCYNLDGALYDNAEEGGPKLNLRGPARFSNPAGTGNPVSPLTRDKSGKFSVGFNISRNTKNIPSTGSSGNTFDTLSMNEIFTITDANIFVALQHGNTSQLELTLFSPAGDSIKLFDNHTSNSNDEVINVVFDDQADSSLENQNYPTFSPEIKPFEILNTKLTGRQSNGKWILKCRDETAGDVGVLYAWGIQFNNNSVVRVNLDVTTLFQGFYNPASNTMASDSLTVIVRELSPPYNILDSSSALVNSSGLGQFIINRAFMEEKVVLQLRHRNSIETWSSGFISINKFNLDFNFTDFDGRAFGSNQILVDTSPDKYAIYGADVNQDDFVDLSDITLIFNDANIFASGYIQTDVTGDNFTDLSDLSIAFNNSINFVSAIVP